MTEALLALVPDYGLVIVGTVVFIATLGVPLPSSIIVLTAGGLAATGDLVFVSLFCVVFFAFVLGDQIAYGIGKIAGPSWLLTLKSKERISPMIIRAESLYDRYDAWAVLLSRTIISPTAPAIAYLSGALEMRRLTYSLTAGIGALIWTSLYLMLGYLFTGQIPEMSALVASMLLVGISMLFFLGFLIWLLLAWHRFENSSVV